MPLVHEMQELVKMARRYLAWREAALTEDDTPVGDLMLDMGMRGEIPTPEQFDAMIDSAINSQRKEGGEG